MVSLLLPFSQLFLIFLLLALSSQLFAGKRYYCINRNVADLWTTCAGKFLYWCHVKDTLAVVSLGALFQKWLWIRFFLKILRKFLDELFLQNTYVRYFLCFIIHINMEYIIFQQDWSEYSVLYFWCYWSTYKKRKIFW